MFDLGEVKDPVEQVCPDGFGTCSSEGPVCATNLQTSADHCGACGRSCLGGPCSSGRCPLQTLTTAGVRPYGIAIDDEHVYFADRDEGTLRRMPKAGGTPVAIATGQSGISFVAADPGTTGFVYFTRDTADGTVAKVNKAGSTVTTLAQAPNAWELAIDQTHVYYTTRGNPLPNDMLSDGTLQRVNKTGGAAQRLAATSGTPGSIALDDDSIYFTDKDAKTVNRLSKTAPQMPVVLAPYQPGPDGIALDGDNIFWGCFEGDTVMRLAKEETQPVVLATFQGNPNGITAGGNFAYYSTYRGGTVSRVSADGGEPLVLAAVNAPIRLALDESYVYFTGSGEEMGAHGVYRVPR